MINFVIDRRKVNQLRELVGGSEKKLRQQLKIAVNETASKTKTSMAKQVAQEIATAQKNIKKTIEIKKKADANNSVPTAIVTQKETTRIPLKNFNVKTANKRVKLPKKKQTKGKKTKKKSIGISYQISKTGGKKTILSAFQIEKFGGHVFKRTSKERTPILKLFGPSPWGVFSKKKLKAPTVKESRKELRRQVDRRLRFLRLKKSGAI